MLVPLEAFLFGLAFFDVRRHQAAIKMSLTHCIY
jgi:hypothetical protein